jgi:hypothetical protein
LNPTALFDNSSSKIRQVPDNQEVYLDADGFGSIQFDILERVTEKATDEACLIYHLEDLIDEKDRVCVTKVEAVQLSNMPYVRRKKFSLTLKS